MPTIRDPDDAELRRLVAIVSADWPEDEKAEALAAALADREAALVCFRALVAERATDTRAHAPTREADDGMRACIDCANLSPGGRCLAAWRGESMGAGIATSRSWRPREPERPQRCGAYKPGPADSDRRTGRERWPFLFGEQSAVNARATGYASGGPEPG